MPHTLVLIITLLAAAVVVVVVCRLARLPLIVGYLVVGVAVGRTRWRGCLTTTRRVTSANSASVFLMFSIGLEFSLPQLRAMRRAVFGLGLAQVAITNAVAMIALHFVGYGWQAGWCWAARWR
jgi:CPA2 family monovalent cation:H+ antiporter-2